jgi:hypothetical protein
MHSNTYYVLWYQTPDDGQKTCPKHAEFYSKNKFEKLVHFVGFIIRICHDARSSECHIRQGNTNSLLARSGRAVFELSTVHLTQPNIAVYSPTKQHVTEATKCSVLGKR